MTSLFDFQSENVKWVHFLDDRGTACVTCVPLDRSTVVTEDCLWDSISRSKKKEKQPFDLDIFLQMIGVDRDVYGK